MGRLRIAILSSSRADYGIYRPLLYALQKENCFELNIIAFGTHLSEFHGYTLQQILDDNFTVQHIIENMLLTDSSETIGTSMGLTMIKFSTLWGNLKDKTDLILCLGDRYEMFAAVLASVSYQIPVAHLHGGEISLGAIDNIFRHSITLASKYHFTATEKSKRKVIEIIDSSEHVFNVGALSLDNLNHLKLLSLEEFKDKYGIDCNHPTILTTFHPETINYEDNLKHTDELIQTFNNLLDNYQIIITMPNTDTKSSIIRKKLIEWGYNKDKVFIVENFGTLGYFSAMKHVGFLLGNTSSGIIEAASLGKYVINIGERQKGREIGENIWNIPINKNIIWKLSKKLKNYSHILVKISMVTEIPHIK